MQGLILEISVDCLVGTDAAGSIQTGLPHIFHNRVFAAELPHVGLSKIMSDQ